MRNHKLNEEDLKARIEVGLEGKHQSETLQRIMVGKVK